MRDIIRTFVKAVSEVLPIPEPVYEFGSFQVEGQEDFADLRPLFLGKEYVGCDMRPGKGVDLILNLHDIDLPDSTVGTALILDTLEHVEFCRRAISEVYRVLKPGGTIITSSVMNFPIHDYPHDYWRFTPEGFKSLLSQFSFSLVEFLGEDHFPHTVVGIGIKDKNVPAEDAECISRKVGGWKRAIIQSQRPNPIKNTAKRFMPPILIGFYRSLRG